MTAERADNPISDLAPEWRRIELLAHCLAQARQGCEVSAEVMDELTSVQRSVEELRNGAGPWNQLLGRRLEPLEYDVLAAAAAVEVEPRLGWLFQSLQPGMPRPYATAALLQELLALQPGAAAALFAALGEDGKLRRDRLIELDELGLYEPFRLHAEFRARLLQLPEVETPPAGAVRVRATADWDDLVLPADQIAMLQEFLYWVRHRATVVGAWGGGDCGGPVALFSGPSGTGKTFAAAVMACQLGWPLYRVDLGKLISKYIGETEKNLNRLFDAADGREMLLQFDEADSVFGKRGEIKEARDRYANMEVSHLLARVESHRGPCILTTNLRGNLDPAFARRFQVVVDFPRPDAGARARLWQRLLPAQAPLSPELDPAFLGEAVSLTGGGIRNAALHAAYLAAAEDKPLIRLRHIALAAWRELGKEGRELSPVDLGPLWPYLELAEEEAC